MVDPIMNTYGRLQVGFVRGEGAWLYDTEGNRYLDALAGLGVCALGHAHPKVTKTISDQAGQLMHTSNLYQIPLQNKLAQDLVRISGMESIFFANTGAEANECAIKISRLHANKNSIANPTIIVAEGSFHGRTLATLTATGNRKVQAGFEPLVNGFVRAPFNDIEAIGKIGENNTGVIAVMIEAIQGEGGIQIADDKYLRELRAICDQKGWFMILDEVQTGNGRTGKYFAYQHAGILPDIVTTAKGLANGFPIGVCMARGEAASVLQPGNHGSTFGGNPLACAVALSVIETIEGEKLAQRAEQLGEKMLDSFRKRLSGSNRIQDIRGKGLMLGIELNIPCTELVQQAKEKGILINVTVDKVVRLLPPLIISDEQADQITETISDLINAL
jgi:acetylornithine aminotransferase|tara:strand:- start:491 stop:1657 length:1167 start_codon:yes stop_codon:yes gene_type:complete